MLGWLVQPSAGVILQTMPLQHLLCKHCCFYLFILHDLWSICTVQPDVPCFKHIRHGDVHLPAGLYIQRSVQRRVHAMRSGALQVQLRGAVVFVVSSRDIQQQLLHAYLPGLLYRHVQHIGGRDSSQRVSDLSCGHVFHWHRPPWPQFLLSMSIWDLFNQAGAHRRLGLHAVPDLPIRNRADLRVRAGIYSRHFGVRVQPRLWRGGNNMLSMHRGVLQPTAEWTMYAVSQLYLFGDNRRDSLHTVCHLPAVFQIHVLLRARVDQRQHGVLLFAGVHPV